MKLKFKNLKSHLSSPLIMWLVIIVGGAVFYKINPKIFVFSQNFLTSFIFLLCIIYWLFFVLSALKVHREAAKSPVLITKLVTSGVYSKSRHPIYAADIILSWGVFLFLPRIDILIIVIWLNLVLLYWIRIEEKALIAKFGDEYRKYKKKTPMLFPKIITNSNKKNANKRRR